MRYFLSVVICFSILVGGAARGEGQGAARDISTKVMDIAERHFIAGRFEDARRYYKLYIRKYSSSPVSDYARYKIALSFYYDKNFDETVAILENFLTSYQTSVWYDKAYETLCSLYFQNFPVNEAVEKLRITMKKYYRENIGDYAEVLIGLLYYMAKDYNSAEAELSKVSELSVYYYTASMITDDMADVKKGAAPSFEGSTTDTYRVFEAYKPITASFTAYESKDEPTWIEKAIVRKAGKFSIVHNSPDSISLKVSKGCRVAFRLKGLKDLDLFYEYIINKNGESEPMKMVEEGAEKDLIYIQWVSDGGNFLEEKELPVKMWEAPGKSGTYRVSARVSDLGLVRIPDKGARKDGDKEFTATITVEE